MRTKIGAGNAVSTGIGRSVAAGKLGGFTRAAGEVPTAIPVTHMKEKKGVTGRVGDAEEVTQTRGRVATRGPTMMDAPGQDIGP